MKNFSWIFLFVMSFNIVANDEISFFECDTEKRVKMFLKMNILTNRSLCLSSQVPVPRNSSIECESKENDMSNPKIKCSKVIECKGTYKCMMKDNVFNITSLVNKAMKMEDDDFIPEYMLENKKSVK